MPPQEARDHSFDELARGLASGSISRGKALRLMGAALVGGALASVGIGEASAAPGGCKRNGKLCKNDDRAVAKTARAAPALMRRLCVERLAQPAALAVIAVTATARVACALSLVFRLVQPAPPGVALLTAPVRLHRRCINVLRT